MAEELDIFEDTTAEEKTFDNPLVMAAQEQAEELQYGDAIDWEATYADAAKYLGVSEAEWQAFVEEVNAIKAEMNAYEGNAARVMQERSTPNALRDRRVAVLLNQNPGMTPEEAIAIVEANPEYQQMVASFEQYEALNSRLNDLYESIGLDTQGSITGSDKSIEGGEIRFDLNTGGITFVELGKTGRYAKMGIGIAAGFIFGGPLGQALAQGLGVSAGVGAGIVSGVAGSALSQGIANGKIDTGQLLTAGILGGIGGLADDLAAGVQQTGAIPNAIDNAIWDLSGTLGMSYEETLRILQGVTEGAITGADLESIVAGAVGGYSEAKIAEYMRNYFGDTIDVENFFKEGQTDIPVEALTPLVGTAIQGLIEGGISDEDLIQTVFDYFGEGGSLSFLLPPDMPLPEFLSGLGVALPDIDFPDIDLPDVDLPDIDLPDVDLPDVDIDLPDVDLPDVDVDLPDVDLPDVDLPDVDLPDVDLPDVDLPDVDLPDASLPDVDTPDIDIPSIDIQLPTASVGFPSSGSFSPTDIRGLSYQPVQPMALIATPQKDYAAELEALIKRNAKGLFEGVV